MDKIFKFRGKSKKDDIWIYGNSVKKINNKFFINNEDEYISMKLILKTNEVKPETVEKYIGQGNHKKIYGKYYIL